MDFKISVVMAAYNAEAHISEAIDSVINQSIGFKNNIQLIIINDASSDSTFKIAKKYQEKYPQNIVLINNDENKGASFTRNLGLKHVKGKYVNFLDSDDKISRNSFKKAYNFLNEHGEVDIVSIPIYFFGDKKGSHPLNYKFKKTQVIDLEKDPDFIQLSGASSFFRFETIKNYSFPHNLEVSEDPLFINQILLKNPKIGFLHDCKYFYRKEDNTSSLIASSVYQKSYFTSRVDNYFIELIRLCDGNVFGFIQNVILYDLYWMCRIEKVDDILTESEINELFDKIIYILSFIDEDAISNQRIIPDSFKIHLLLIKKLGWDYLKNKSYEDVGIDLNKISIDIFEFKNKNELYISGIFTTFIKEESEIFAVLDDGILIKSDLINYSQRKNYSLGFEYAYNYSFEVTLPVKGKIAFKSNFKNLTIGYNPTSRLSRISRYKLSKDYLALDKLNYIEIIKRTPVNTFKNELNTLKHILQQRSQGWRTALILRLLYFLTYFYYNNKKIWVFNDLLYKADDNAFRLFNYINQNEFSGIKNVFALEKSYNNSSVKKGNLMKLLGRGEASNDYKKIQKIGNAVPYASLKHRLYTLHAEAIISSHPSNNIIYPIWGNYEFLSGLVKAKIIFLQHGVTLHDVSGWLNKFDKNLDLIVTVSDSEKESFKNSDYGYSQDIIQVLGFPRFDYLKKSDDKKEIVIMPTWRRQFENLSGNEFIESDFFKVFDRLLNDEELINFLKSKDYKLVFKPHPNLIRFSDKFNHHCDVIFDINNRSYTDIFNHSSLLITDFSSVAFDFAYLEKPVIYYHYGDDFHFDIEKSYFKYDKMGFGPVINTHDDLKSSIISFVDNDCKMDETYIKRVNEFFKFHDRNNSKRVYNAIKKLDKYY